MVQPGCSFPTTMFRASGRCLLRQRRRGSAHDFSVPTATLSTQQSTTKSTREPSAHAHGRSTWHGEKERVGSGPCGGSSRRGRTALPAATRLPPRCLGRHAESRSRHPQTRVAYDVVDIVRRWKSWTAHRINEIDGGRGPLWQREPSIGRCESRMRCLDGTRSGTLSSIPSRRACVEIPCPGNRAARDAFLIGGARTI